MDATYDNANRVYIKSNTATAMRFLWFLSALLLVLVVGLCAFVVWGKDDTQNYHWDEAGQFYYTLDNNEVTVVRHVNNETETYTMPDSVNYGGKSYPVKKIGVKAFTNHANLKSLTVSDNVTEIVGDTKNKTGAFAGCSKLTTVKLGQNVTRIGGYAFKNCLALNMIEFPSSVQFIDDGAFQNCVALQKIGLNSNGIVGNDCFADCINVNTLQLADDVRLSDDLRHVLSGLSKLATFEITENHSLYTVQNVGNGQCLLSTTDHANDAVVLGGVGATVPAGVTQILDWAWGNRAADNFYIPSTVTKVFANSFDCNAVCTDTNTKPVGWLTTVMVNTKAQLITFTAVNDNTAHAYIYQDASGKIIYPTYEDLFANVVSDTPFAKWGDLVGTTCAAVYVGETYASSLDDLNMAKTVAAGYLNDADKRLKFTIDFWNDYKSIYDQAAEITDPNTTYQYIVDDLVAALTAVNSKIDSADDTAILESADWWIGLKNLIDAVDAIDVLDLAITVGTDTLDQLLEIQDTAEFIVANRSHIDQETGIYVWKNLREAYENLAMDVGTGSHLAQEISICENLDRTKYTQASWQKLQKQLVIAKQLTTHNLSVSIVRKNLVQARTDLREVTWADNLIYLGAWLSLCSDLSEADYQAAEYDRLMLDVQNTIANVMTLTNNKKVKEKIANLQNRYTNLVPTNNTTAYTSGNTGVLNKNSLPYFITAVVLFTWAVVAGAVAGRMKHQLRQTQE